MIWRPKGRHIMLYELNNYHKRQKFCNNSYYNRILFLYSQNNVHRHIIDFE